MITAHDLPPDHFGPEAGNDKRLTTWYAQGHSDGLGDRLLMFDNTNAPSWEILRFRATLAHDPRFEAALRQRVEQLASFQHDGFATVRPIKRLDEGLAVVSTYSGGAALTEALKKPRSAEFALRLIRQLLPALGALHNVAPGVAHGAITTDRIILSPEGRLIIRENMVGSALESLEWPSDRFWLELGVLVPPSPAAVKIDARTDLAQLALVALSMMAGRRLGPDEYPDRTIQLLDELTLKNHWHNAAKFQTLRRWLERALQLDEQPFESAQEAQAALGELQQQPETTEVRATEALRVPPKEVVVKEAPGNETPVKEEYPTPPMWSASRGLPAPIVQPPKPAPIPLSNRVAGVRDRAVRTWRGVPPPVVRWATVALAVVAIAEAILIGRLLSIRSAEPAVETTAARQQSSGQALRQDSGQVPASTPIAAIQTIPQPPTPSPIVVATAAVNAKAPDIRALQPPAPAVRTGGVRVLAPIELHVLDGERVVGSTGDNPIFATAGRHEFEFVNSTIGYRVRQVVEVKAGQITPFTVPVPNGNLNINALPWASITIDGNAAGETPIGNLSVLPGEHEIIFRHPQLGERRERALVRPGVETRVSVNLQK